jgi:hypothetical protein
MDANLLFTRVIDRRYVLHLQALIDHLDAGSFQRL